MNIVKSATLHFLIWLHVFLFRIFLRTAGDECFRTYYSYNVVEMLLAGIDVADLAEAAADALVCGFLRDTTNHLLRFEGNVANIEFIVDVCMHSPHNVQAHLLNFFVFAFRSPTSREMVRIALEMGIVGLLSSTLKIEGSPVQEVSVYCLHSLLLKVTKTKEFKLMLLPLITEVVQFGIVEQLTKIIIASENGLEHPICASAVEIYSIVSFEKLSHASLVAHVHVLSSKSKKVASSLASNALQRMLDFMTDINRSSLKHFRELHTAVTHIFMVIHNLNSLSPELGIKATCAKILAPSLTILCQAEGLARSGCAEFVYLYKDSDDFDGAVTLFEDYDDLFNSLIYSIEKDNVHNVVNYSMDLLAIVLQKLHRLKFPVLNSDGPQRNKLRNNFIMIMEHDLVWRQIVDYLEHPEKALFAMKLINVFATFKDLFVLHYVQERITQYKLIDSIVDLTVNKSMPAVVREAAYLALGSLIGCSPIYPYEHDSLNRLGGNYLGKSAEPLRRAQRRANLDEGSSLRELKLQCHNPLLLSYEINTGMTMEALVQKVWQVEMQWRGFCVQKASVILQPAIATKTTVILPIAMAALRIIQIILRDGASEEDSFHKNIEYYSFVAFLNQIDQVYLILALDVFGVMSAFSDISVDNGIEFVCSLLSSPDPMIKYKALETLIFCSLNTNTLECIGLNALSALTGLLKLSTHISNPIIDSHFMLHGVLVVISRLLADDASSKFVVKSSTLPMILEILKLDEQETVLLNYEMALSLNRACVQDIDPLYHRRTPTVDMTSVTIHKLSFECVCRFAKHESCRMPLLNADVAPVLMACVAAELVMAQSGVQLPPLLRPQSLTLQQSLSEDGTLALTGLFYLCSRGSHPLLTSEVLQEYFSVESLIFLWASQNRSFGVLARIILARCSLVKDARPSAAAGSNIITNTCHMQPWKKLIETKQVGLLFDLLNHSSAGLQREELTAVSFDDAADMQLKSSVCEAVNAIVLEARHNSTMRGIAMKVDAASSGMLSQSGSSNNLLSGHSSENNSPRGSPEAAEGGGSESNVDLIFRAINKFCSPDILRSLEGLRMLSTHVATFLLEAHGQQGQGSHSVMLMPIVRALSNSRSPTPSFLQGLDITGNGNISTNSSVCSGKGGGGGGDAGALFSSGQSIGGNSGISAITMSVSLQQPANARDRRQVFKSLASLIRSNTTGIMKKDELGMSVTGVVETITEITQEIQQRLHMGSKLNEYEALEAINGASDCLQVVMTLYEMKCITLAYQSELHVCLITADHIILDLRPIFDILLQLCRKKTTATVFYSSPFVVVSLAKTLQICFDALPSILDHPNVKGNEKRLPELIAVWQSFTVLLTLSKLGEPSMAEKLLAAPGAIKLLVQVFTMELSPAMTEVFYLSPWSSELFNFRNASGTSSSSSTVNQNVREMSLFDRILSSISVLSCGKAAVIEALLADQACVLTHLSELIQADLSTTFPHSPANNPNSSNPTNTATMSPNTTQRKSISRNSSPRLSVNASASNSPMTQQMRVLSTPTRPPLQSLSGSNLNLHNLPPMPLHHPTAHHPNHRDDDAESVISTHSAVHSYFRLHEHSAVQNPDYMMDYLARKLLILVNVARCPQGAKSIAQDGSILRRVSDVVQNVLPLSRPISGGQPHSSAPGAASASNLNVLKHVLYLYEHLAPILVTEDTNQRALSRTNGAPSLITPSTSAAVTPTAAMSVASIPPWSTSQNPTTSALPGSTPTPTPATPTLSTNNTNRVRITAININTHPSAASSPMPLSANGHNFIPSTTAAVLDDDLAQADYNISERVTEVVQMLIDIAFKVTDLTIIDQVFWLVHHRLY